MDEGLARRMHDLLAHKDGQFPGSCPVCYEQNPPPPKEDAIEIEVPSIVRDRG